MKFFTSLLVAGLVMATPLTSGIAFAQAKADAASTSNAPSASSNDMTEGEIRKIDKDTGKITIKHGEIKNLSMPGMTMVFQVKDKALLDKIKPGDKVRFTVVSNDGNMVVTDIQSVK